MTTAQGRTRDVFDNLSSLDSRYWDEEVAAFLSENAFTKTKLEVEMALVRVLHRRGFCSAAVVEEVQAACALVTTAEVYDEEARIGHDIRALVNCIQSKIGEDARPFVHLTATSYDIIDTANALRYRRAVQQVLIPWLIKLMDTLIKITLRDAETRQIGRTHGQHAVPITFGFTTAEYVSRLGPSVLQLRQLSSDLRGKFSGAVGAFNASSLFFEDPEGFENEVLAELDLEAAEYSTQIVPPEALVRLLSEVTTMTGVLANLANDMRHLQRSEIREVGEAVSSEQVGSSTMAHKENPINFENAVSMWKILMPRMITAFLDQVSDHQRDLTNSASGRTYGEMFVYAVLIIKRLRRTLDKLVVRVESMNQNFSLGGDQVLAEPFYLALAYLGHPDAHELARVLSRKARSSNRSLMEVAEGDEELRQYLSRMTPKQRQILSDPSLYTGSAAKVAVDIANSWRQTLGL